MKIMEEFRKFIARGNVLDLAVGVVIGAAFGKITTSLTEGIIMPTLGWVFGDIDFSNLFIQLGPIPADYTGSPTNYAELKEAGVAMIGYGDFLTQVVNFLLLAFALFMMLKAVNRVLEEMQSQQIDAEETATTDQVPTDPQLDVLKKILAELKAEKSPPSTSN
ncbi:MAG: large conductance mechanosensitive channel protein MscL [Erythrobacter sp.]|uniref:large conductance mechanosensitive channel protein MscL n=1 Tax=Erythrobacter sp. TaxID=1042 RepID=UPI003C767A50